MVYDLYLCIYKDLRQMSMQNYLSNVCCLCQRQFMTLQGAQNVLFSSVCQDHSHVQ
jgi:hypothetical protein